MCSQHGSCTRNDSQHSRDDSIGRLVELIRPIRAPLLVAIRLPLDALSRAIYVLNNTAKMCCLGKRLPAQTVLVMAVLDIIMAELYPARGLLLDFIIHPFNFEIVLFKI